MAFKYQARDPKAWEKRADQQGSDFKGVIIDDVETYTPKKGDNFVRILPPTFENPEHYGMDVWVHYGIGPDRASALCLHKMKNEKCPICDARMAAERRGDEDMASELKASRRVLVWILDRNDQAKGPMAWTMPWTLDRDICKISRDKRTGQIYTIDDPNEGYDLSFEREGEKMQVKYTGIQLSRRPSSVDEDTLDYISELPLTEILVWRNFDELSEMFGSGGEPASERGARPGRDAPRNERAEAAPARRESSAPPARRALPQREQPDARDQGVDEDDIPFDQPAAQEDRPQTRRPMREADPEPERAAPPPTSGGSRAAELRARLNAAKK